MLSGNKKPVSELLATPSFNQDVTYEYEEAGADREMQKHQLVIPYAEFTDQSKPSAKLNSADFLKAFLVEKGFKTELSASTKRNLAMRIMWQREVVDQDSLHEAVQMWLLAMQEYNTVKAGM